MKEKILIGFFLIAVFVSFLGPIRDIDFPFHLKTGEYIFEHRTIPQDDPFSFPGKGILTDKKIFTLSQYWLAQVIFYKVYAFSGPAGIILLRSAIFSSFVFLLWLALRKRGLYSSLLIAILATLVLLSSSLDRPQYFSFLFTLILILLLERFRGKPDSVKPLFFIPPLMLLWSNMHGGFVFGLAVIFIYTMAEALKFFVLKIKLAFPIGHPLSGKSILMLLSACFLATLFSYINPNTNAALIMAFDSHTNTKWLYSAIREYMSPLEDARFSYGVKISNMSFWVLFGITCIFISLNTIRKKSIDITTIALVFFSSVAALTAIRYIPFFIALAIPLMKDYSFFKNPSFFRRKDKSLVISILLSVLFSTFFIYVIVLGLKDYKDIFKFKSQSYYPERAANFLLANHIDANMFNSNNRGSYLLWKLYPYYRVFQDTRYLSLEETIEGDAIRFALNSPKQSEARTLESALSKLVPPALGKIEISTKTYPVNSDTNTPLWKSLLKKYNIDLIVHEATADFTGIIFPLTLRLLKDDGWVLIYLDGNMEIFVRNTEKYAEIIKKFHKPKELIYDEIILETFRLVRMKTTYPTPYSSLAFALMMKGKEEDAKKMIDAALDLDKNDLVANFCNAYLALRQKGSKNLAKEPGHPTK